jgi:catechol 2,3-dioxygenase-like lactoylglutathione lyase family enzyme
MPAFRNLGHIALRCHDLEASIAFYEKLGFPEFLRLNEEDGKPWIVYMRFGDDLYLELFPDGPDERVPGPAATGVTHLCLTVDDLDVAEAHLKEVGIPLSQPRRQTRGVDGNRGMWIEDPDGNRIEIMEMAPNCIQYEAIRALHAGKPPHALLRPRNPRPQQAQVDT